MFLIIVYNPCFYAYCVCKALSTFYILSQNQHFITLLIPKEIMWEGKLLKQMKVQVDKKIISKNKAKLKRKSRSNCNRQHADWCMCTETKKKK